MTLVPRNRRRSGFSLLEVLIALALFLLAIIAISQAIIFANDQAVAAEQRARTARLCQSKLAELISGALPLESVGETPFDEDDSYVWSVDCESGQVDGLWNVSVHVSRPRQDGSVAEECTLSQMVYDPSQRGSTQDVVASNASSSTSSSNSSSSSQGSSSGQSSSGQTNTPSNASGSSGAKTGPSGSTGGSGRPSGTGSGGSGMGSGGGRPSGGSGNSGGSRPSGGSSGFGSSGSGSRPSGSTGSSGAPSGSTGGSGTPSGSTGARPSGTSGTGSTGSSRGGP